MSPALAFAVVAALLALATIVGLSLRHRDGHRRDGGDLRFDPADADGKALGTAVTLVQFSTEMCTRCPQVHRLLASYADAEVDLAHIEVDLTNRPDLSVRYRVLQTPTTFILDAAGVVHARFAGLPARDGLADAIATARRKPWSTR